MSFDENPENAALSRNMRLLLTVAAPTRGSVAQASERDARPRSAAIVRHQQVAGAGLVGRDDDSLGLRREAQIGERDKSTLLHRGPRPSAVVGGDDGRTGPLGSGDDDRRLLGRGD